MEEYLLWLINTLWGIIQEMWNILVEAIYYLWEGLYYFWQLVLDLGKWALDQVTLLLKGLRKVADVLWRGLKAVEHLNFRSIWNAIKRGYERLRRALDWYYRHVMAPLDRIRRQIWEIYARFFKPLLRILDSFRVMVRVLALFNRKLAAKLDARLLALEGKLLSPITAMLKRVNVLSSHMRALITALGYLDRMTFLETMRRDALLVWEVLTNPRGRIFDKPTPPAARTQAQRVADTDQFVRYRTGYYADAALRLDGVWRDLEAGA